MVAPLVSVEPAPEARVGTITAAGGATMAARGEVAARPSGLPRERRCFKMAPFGARALPRAGARRIERNTVIPRPRSIKCPAWAHQPSMPGDRAPYPGYGREKRPSDRLRCGDRLPPHLLPNRRDRP